MPLSSRPKIRFECEFWVGFIFILYSTIAIERAVAFWYLYLHTNTRKQECGSTDALSSFFFFILSARDCNWCFGFESIAMMLIKWNGIYFWDCVKNYFIYRTRRSPKHRAQFINSHHPYSPPSLSLIIITIGVVLAKSIIAKHSLLNMLNIFHLSAINNHPSKHTITIKKSARKCVSTENWIDFICQIEIFLSMRAIITQLSFRPFNLYMEWCMQ